MSYLVHLQQFEGPLGLLLYLIRKEEMDILDINVGEITRQYLEYIRMMKELDLEVAGEFVAMAATLIHIKSRLLLPQYNDEGEVVEAADDPRKELVQKLLEYQRYQEAAKTLYERPLLNRDVFARGLREDLRGQDTETILGAIITEEDGLFSLISAYRRAVRKAQKAVHKVRPKVQSIAGRILDLKDRLIVGVQVILRDLVSAGDQSVEPRARLLITFLSMLELGRMGFVSLFQNDTYGDIYVQAKRPIERNVLERVQEFEGEDAEAVAKSIINEANESRIDEMEKIDMSEAMLGEQLGLSDLSGVPLAQTTEEGELTEMAAEAADMASDDEILAAERELAIEDLSDSVVHVSASGADIFETEETIIADHTAEDFTEDTTEEAIKETIEAPGFGKPSGSEPDATV